MQARPWRLASSTRTQAFATPRRPRCASSSRSWLRTRGSNPRWPVRSTRPTRPRAPQCWTCSENCAIGERATFRRAAEDRDVRVRLQATRGLVALLIREAVAPEWQVRVGAVRGLTSATADQRVPVAVRALSDTHADVRKAAVIALTGDVDEAEVADALEVATKDVDADVRGYARRAIGASRRIPA